MKPTELLTLMQRGQRPTQTKQATPRPAQSFDENFAKIFGEPPRQSNQHR